MKNVKFVGFIAIAAVMGFALIACNTEKKDEGGKKWLGTGELKFSNEQVYTQKAIDPTALAGDIKAEYEKFTGNVNKLKGVEQKEAPGSGNITSGKLTYVVPAPTPLAPFNAQMIEGQFEYWKNVKIDNGNVKGAMFSQALEEDSERAVSKAESKIKMNMSTGSISGSGEMVMFMYVDSNVKITGEGDTKTKTEQGTTTTITSKNFSLSLKKGWNAVATKISVSGNMMAPNMTISMSVNNPNLKWVLGEADDDDNGFGFGFSVLVTP